MRHIHSITEQERNKLFCARAKIFRNYLVTSQETFYFDDDIRNPLTALSWINIFFTSCLKTGRLTLYGANDSVAKELRNRNPKAIKDSVELYSWERDTPGVLPDRRAFRMKPSNYKSPIGSFYGTPVIRLDRNVELILPTKTKFTVALYDKKLEKLEHRFEVSDIKSFGQSGGGHGEGYWDDGFALVTEIGYLIPDPLKHKVLITLNHEDIKMN